MTRPHASLLGAAALSLFAVLGAAPPAAAGDDDRWSDLFYFDGSLDGAIHALLPLGDQLIAGGAFARSGNTASARAALWDGQAWRPLGDGPPREVRALAMFQSALYAGGHRWDGAQWVDALQANDAVHALLPHGGVLYAAGQFTWAGGIDAARIVAWDGAFCTPLGAGFDHNVNSLALHDGLLVAGGFFTQAGGRPAARVAVWDGTGWAPLGEGLDGVQQWCCDPYGQTLYFPAQVRALASHGGDLYAGGRFTTSGQDTVRTVARWDGQAWRLVGGGIVEGACRDVPDVGVSCFAPQVASLLTGPDGRLHAGGLFSAAGGEPARGVAAWDGTAWSALGAGLGDAAQPQQLHQAWTLAAHGGRLLAGGDFLGAGGRPARHLAAWDGATWERWPAPWGLGLDGPVDALLVHDGRLLAGGAFGQAGGAAGVGGLAVFDGEAWAPLAAGAAGGGVADGESRGRVQTLLAAAEGLIIGGRFTSAGGVPARHVARWDGGQWLPLGDGPPCQEVLALALHDGALYAAGRQGDFGKLFRWDDPAWSEIAHATADQPCRITSLASLPGGLAAGGDFQRVNGLAAGRLFLWDGAACRELGGGLGGGAVSCLLAESGVLYAGGDFVRAGDVIALGIAGWDGRNWQALGEGFDLNDGGGVRALAFFADRLYAGGSFARSRGGAEARGVAVWDGQAWHVLGSGAAPDVRALAVYDGDLFVGGGFAEAGGKLAAALARWREAGVPIEVQGLAVVRRGEGAELRWRVATEPSPRFHVWRQDAGEARVRLTAAAVRAEPEHVFYDAAPPAGAATYWLQQLASPGPERWHGPAVLPPAGGAPALALAPARPNPFNPRVRLAFELSQPGAARLTVHDAGGRLVAVLLAGELAAGAHEAEWDGRASSGRPAAAGTYFARLSTAQGARTRALTLVR